MEPPSKRQRLSLAESPESAINIDLQKARARNDQKLKSLFEGIFEKYGKDFSDIGDEIDLQTGEIIVNKGHVLHMEREDDTGESPEPTPCKKIKSSRLLDRSSNHGDQTAEDLSPYPTSKKARKAFNTSWDENFQINNAARLLSDDGSRLPASSPIRLNSSTANKRPTDPLWQTPEINAKFWTPPPKKEMPTEIRVTPRMDRSPSPPTATSIWAIRTPGRPRGLNQNVSSNKKSSVTRSKRKRRVSVRLDWSFADIGSNDSDSDDPLQEDAPSSNIRPTKIRGPNSASNTPTPKVIKLIPNDDTNSIKYNVEPAGVENIDYDEEAINTTIRTSNTPELRSSSPVIAADDTPTQSHYAINIDSPSIRTSNEIILTPDEVKLIIQLKCESSKALSWEDITKDIPGRTLDDLLDWADRRSLLLNSSIITTSGWTQNELERLDEFADQSGIWWRDFQVAFPHRSRKEIENQMIRIWTERTLEEIERRQHNEDHNQEPTESLAPEQESSPVPYSDNEDHDQEPVEALVPEREPSPIPSVDENDPALKTGQVMTVDDSENVLEEDSDNDWTGISAIGVKPWGSEVSGNSARSSPRKGSISPRKYY